ncbi:uncharacterized protein LOC134653585 [Cydia amplana]|uniref:uncharacterized protein LOC134653585 n=1 Tax=Cydia amplana TaxID=1869771 RepID=UPI002FE5895C
MRFPDCSSRLASALFYLRDYLEAHGLTLSVPKCKAVVFTRKKNIPPIELSLEGQEIEIVNSPPQASIFTGEAVALYEAITYIKSHNQDKSIILTDSLSCLQDLKRLPFHSKDNFFLTLKIKDKLRECHDANLQVVLAWIPSHSGITGNEVVDQCAKAAIHQSFASDQKCFTRDIRSSIRCLLFEKWNKLWQLSRRAKGQHYGNLQPNIPPKPWFFKHKGYSNVVTSNIIRLRLGHICSPVRLAKSRIRDSSICECGLDEGWMDTLPNTVYTSPTIFIVLAVCYPTSTLAESSSPDGAIIHKN